MSEDKEKSAPSGTPGQRASRSLKLGILRPPLHEVLRSPSGPPKKTGTPSDEERIQFSLYINENFKDDPELKSVIPIDPKSSKLFDAVKSGVLLWYIYIFVSSPFF
jgi:hypothetical protein